MRRTQHLLRSFLFKHPRISGGVAFKELAVLAGGVCKGPGVKANCFNIGVTDQPSKRHRNLAGEVLGASSSCAVLFTFSKYGFDCCSRLHLSLLTGVVSAMLDRARFVGPATVFYKVL